MELKLPTIVIGQSDVTRLMRELNSIEDALTAAKARQAGSVITSPRLSNMLGQVVSENKSDILDQKQRQDLTVALGQILKSAPLLHLSFAVDPPARVLDRILIWLRINIHPQVLVQVGLQPTIAAGCILRTPNKVFDMSLRAALKKQEPYMAQLIAGASSGR